jgi:hypothetical protein
MICLQLTIKLSNLFPKSLFNLGWNFKLINKPRYLWYCLKFILKINTQDSHVLGFIRFTTDLDLFKALKDLVKVAPSMLPRF